MRRFFLLMLSVCLLVMLIACSRQTPNEDSVPTEVGASGAPTSVTGTESSAPTRATNPDPTTGAQENTPTTPTGSTDPTEQSQPTEVTTAPTKAPVVTNPTVVTDPTVATQPEEVVPETTVPELEEDGYNSQIIRP